MPIIRSDYSDKSPYFLPHNKFLEMYHCVLAYDFYKAGNSNFDHFTADCIESAAREIMPEDPGTWLAAVTNEDVKTIPGMTAKEYNKKRRIFYFLVYKKRHL